MKLIHTDERPGTRSGDYSEEGVDISLIRWMLSLDPPGRLEVLQQHMNAVEKLRAAAKRD